MSKSVQITVQSANHKYRALMDTDTVAIACVSSNYVGKWEKKKDPRWIIFSHKEILAHNAKKYHFTLRASSPDRNGWSMGIESINADPFKKIQDKLKAFRSKSK